MKKKITPEMKAQIMDKIAKGETMAKLAREHGIGVGTLYSWRHNEKKKEQKSLPIVFTTTKTKPKANRKTYPVQGKTTEQLRQDLTEANNKIAELKEERDLFRKLSFRLLKNNGA